MNSPEAKPRIPALFTRQYNRACGHSDAGGDSGTGTIGGTLAADTGGVYLIAEIGTAHQGDLAKGFSLIDAARDAGADCVKFQLVIADEIIHPKTGLVNLPGGEIPLYERFKAVERDISFYRALKEHAEKRGIDFLCTPFGLGSARMLRSLNVGFLKIASPELNHIPLLEEISGYGLPVFLSSGVSRIGDIEEALAYFPERAILLHCVTSYPAPEEDYNLSLLPHISSLFGVPVGVSDHSLHPLLVPLLGIAMGATAIEKHFTLSREGSGLDDPIALTPADFGAMTTAVREWERKGKEGIVADLADKFGETRVKAILGTGEKRLAPSEAENYGKTNRSIISTAEIERGAVFSAENCGILRSEKNILPGLHPRYLKLVCGRRAARDIPAGTGIQWDDVIPPAAQ